MKRSCLMMYGSGTAQAERPDPNNQKAKRTMATTQEFVFKVPTQQQRQELGSFWVSSSSTVQLNHHQMLQPASSPCSPRGHWREEEHGGLTMSISLASNCRRPCSEADVIDTQDTASSGRPSQPPAGGSSQHQPRAAGALCTAAAAGKAASAGESSITSGQSHTTCAAAGAAVCAMPHVRCSAEVDVSSLFCWEVLHTVLDRL